jgi:3-oxoacyl-[acyl-carrier-protein] synthase-3
MKNKFFIQIFGISYQLGSISENSEVYISDNPGWNLENITEKTGIKKRHLASDTETALDLAVLAAKKLFTETKVDPLSIDGLIFVTQSPDYILPTTACILQNQLNLKTDLMGFDINLGCSGFVYGLANSISLIEAGMAKKILLICADTYTKYIKRDDRTCRPIFSDGASAILIGHAPKANAEIGPFIFGTDGAGEKNLIVANSAARKSDGTNGLGHSFLHMDGAKVLMFTMSAVPKLVHQTLFEAGIKLEDINLFIFHQASKIVMENISRKLNISQEKVYSNIENIGNTVSSTIPIALKDALDEGRIKNGDTVFIAGFGVGYSWGATIIRWSSGDE